MIDLVLASSNPGKLAEFSASLDLFDLTLRPQSEFSVPDAIEDGLSFIENAIKKARHASKLTGLAALADDSGISVDALGGRPGIYSARYANGLGDTANNTKLLDEMLNQSCRTARFHCCLALVRHANDPTPVICNATWEGTIAESMSGKQGFGYDPLFLPSGFDVTAAQLSKKQKSTFSHRARALSQLRSFLRDHPTWISK